MNVLLIQSIDMCGASQRLTTTRSSPTLMSDQNLYSDIGQGHPDGMYTYLPASTEIFLPRSLTVLNSTLLAPAPYSVLLSWPMGRSSLRRPDQSSYRIQISLLMPERGPSVSLPLNSLLGIIRLNPTPLVRGADSSSSKGESTITPSPLVLGFKNESLISSSHLYSGLFGRLFMFGTRTRLF